MSEQLSEQHGQFHAHLDICEQCRNHPFGLCAEGARLITDAALSYMKLDPPGKGTV